MSPVRPAVNKIIPGAVHILGRVQATITPNYSNNELETISSPRMIPFQPHPAVLEDSSSTTPKTSLLPEHFTPEQIVLTVLAALFAIVFGAFIIRHYHRKLLDDGTEKSVVAGNIISSPIPTDTSTERVPVMSEKQLETSSSTNQKDVSTLMSLKAGMNSVWRRGRLGRERQNSASSQTTADISECCDSIFSTTSVPRSSLSSLPSQVSESEAEGVEEEVVYEVKRAQTHSMEVKRGVLLSCRSSKPAMPSVVISESRSLTSMTESQSIDNGLLHVHKSSGISPSYPSSSSIESTASTASIDLDDFPEPPTAMVLLDYDYVGL
ncbi:hypothetical protein C8J56DRAFT_1044488 [Mycena floridula]|nr:hypothetical protein C8J56DRAFT_1044488 [Mycena floridula]